MGNWYNHASFSEVAFAIAYGNDYNEAIAKTLNIKPPSAFRHTQRLIKEGILKTINDGYRVRYEINPKQIAKDTLKIWDTLLEFSVCIETDEDKNRYDKSMKVIRNSLKDLSKNPLFGDFLLHTLKVSLFDGRETTYRYYARKILFVYIPDYLKKVNKKHSGDMQKLLVSFKKIVSETGGVPFKYNPVKSYFEPQPSISQQ